MRERMKSRFLDSEDVDVLASGGARKEFRSEAKTKNVV
jgi:hypothetical protein